MPFNLDPEQLSILFWGLTIVILLIFWLPALISQMGGTRIRVLGPARMPDPDPMQKEPDFTHWADKLRFHGYEMLSAYSVQVDFVESSWRRTSYWRFFRSPTLPISAVMIKAPEPFNLWMNIELVTLLQNDLVLITTNALGQSPYDPERVLFESVNSMDVSVLESAHRERLDILKREGIRAEGDQREESVCAVLEGNLRENLLPAAKQVSGKFLTVNILIHASASLPFAYWLKPEHFALPMVNFFVALLMRGSDVLEKRANRIAANELIRMAMKGQDSPSDHVMPNG